MGASIRPIASSDAFGRGGKASCHVPIPARAQARRGLAAPMNLELLEDIVDVVLHRRAPNAERAGNLLVRHALLEKAQNLPLPPGQARGQARIGPLGYQSADAAEQQARHPRRAVQLAAQCMLDGGNEILAAAIRRDETSDPRLRTGKHLLIDLPERAGDDLRPGNWALSAFATSKPPGVPMSRMMASGARLIAIARPAAEVSAMSRTVMP